ncbi:MAG TPA: hypothetical protein VKR30_02700 [Candidatus Limnocylindrales bacterium]|nr:hypothetical protein [Candidatus Limnocylindrales bacterium]
MTALLTGVQRAPAVSAVPAAGASARAAPAKRRGSRNSYVDLINGFTALVNAYEAGGAKLDTTPFGPDLTPAHRALQAKIRDAFVQAQAPDQASKDHARAAWPALAASLRAAVEESRQFGISGEGRARTLEYAALVGSEMGAKPAAGNLEAKSVPELMQDYKNTCQAIIDLLWAFKAPPNAPVDAFAEEVAGRKDAIIPDYLLKENAARRADLTAVQFGSPLTGRHAKLLDTLRKTLITSRSESPGSAYSAMTTWRAIASDVTGALHRAQTLGVLQEPSETLKQAESMERAFAAQYARVHGDQLRLQLTAERPAEEAKARLRLEREIQIDKSRNTPAVAARRETDAVRDFQHALSVIEHDLKPSPDYQGEWVITSGAQPVRIREEQAKAMQTAAEAQLNAYMDAIANGILNVWAHYDGIKRENPAWKLRYLGAWGGATDPGDPEHYVDSVDQVQRKIVRPLIAAKKYTEAFGNILNQKAIFEQVAREVGDYDRDLDVGYSRLATCATIVQAALLAIVPVAGEAAVAGGATVLAVAGTAVGTGTVAAGGAEAIREKVSGEDLSARKIAKAGYKGGVVIGGSAALGPATKVAGKAVSQFMGAAEGSSAAVGFEAATSGVAGTLKSELSGDSGAQGFVTSSVGSLVGSATQNLLPSWAQQGVPKAAIGTAAPMGVAAFTGGDVWSAGAAGLVGSAAKIIAAPKPPAAAAAPAAASPGGSRPTLSGTGITPRPPASTGAEPEPSQEETIPGAGIAPRAPAAPPAPPGETGPSAGATLSGTGIAPRPPTVPIAAGASGDTGAAPLRGTGIPPRAPAPPAPPSAPGGGTLAGTGIAPRPPVAPTPTLVGTGVAPRAPEAAAQAGGAPAASGPATLPGTPPPPPAAAGSAVAPASASAPAAGPLTQPSMAPAGNPAGGPSARPRIAVAPEFRNRPPIIGRVAHVIEDQEEAVALYQRLMNEGQRNILGSTEEDLENFAWRSDDGQGRAPLAWVRTGDGVVRFNMSRFSPPSRGGYTSEPQSPIPFAPASGSGGATTGSTRSGGGVSRQLFRLPEMAGAQPLYGPDSKVVRVINDPAEAERLWTRMVGERVSPLARGGPLIEDDWSSDGGVGTVPLAWVRAGDGVVRFNLDDFHPPPAEPTP